MTVRIYRVKVRGRFDGLTAEARAQLLDAAEHHDALDAAFTDEGTFTYGHDLAFFTFRYQVRQADDAGDGPAATAARVEAATAERARTFLDALGIGHRDLRASATDMADVWLP